MLWRSGRWWPVRVFTVFTFSSWNSRQRRILKWGKWSGYLLAFDSPRSVRRPPHVALQLFECGRLPVCGHLPQHIIHHFPNGLLLVRVHRLVHGVDGARPVLSHVLFDLQPVTSNPCALITVRLTHHLQKKNYLLHVSIIWTKWSNLGINKVVLQCCTHIPTIILFLSLSALNKK